MEMVKGYIKTDYRDVDEPTYQTSLPGIYAIGDIIGPPWLACVRGGSSHVRGANGRTSDPRCRLQRDSGVHLHITTGCMHRTDRAGGSGIRRRIRDRNILIPHSARPLPRGATTGFVKIIVSKPYGEILGAHIIGADASELIHEFCLAIRLEATAEDIISTMHAHPTMSESIHEAALDTENRVINS